MAILDLVVALLITVAYAVPITLVVSWLLIEKHGGAYMRFARAEGWYYGEDGEIVRPPT